MANQPEVSQWETGVYQFETTDPVEGGLGGIDNRPLLELSNRTLWLKNRLEALIFPGQVLELDVDAAFVSANFDLTPGVNMGLGINLCEGFALCNGNNGTKDRNGRTGIGYGPNYPTLGAIGGSKDAVIVSHKHNSIEFSTGLKAVNDTGTGPTLNANVELSSNIGSGKVDETGTTGVSGVNQNMQPYIVSLFIMKLP